MQLPLNLDFDISDETIQSTDTLESILGNMTNLHAQEDFGLAVSGYKTDKLLTVNIEEDGIDEQVLESVTTEKERTEMCMDTRVVREIGSEKNIDNITENEKVLENGLESLSARIESVERGDKLEKSEIEKDRLKQERKRERRERRRQAEEAERLRNEEKENDKAKGEEEKSIEEVTAEEILKKEQKKQRAEERNRRREMKRLSAERERNNKKQKTRS